LKRRWRKSKMGKKRKMEKVEPLGEREDRRGEDDTVTGEIGFSLKINVFKLNSRFWKH
jgi:hypothetical protein